MSYKAWSVSCLCLASHLLSVSSTLTLLCPHQLSCYSSNISNCSTSGPLYVLFPQTLSPSNPHGWLFPFSRSLAHSHPIMPSPPSPFTPLLCFLLLLSTYYRLTYILSFFLYYFSPPWEQGASCCSLLYGEGAQEICWMNEWKYGFGFQSHAASSTLCIHSPLVYFLFDMYGLTLISPPSVAAWGMQTGFRFSQKWTMKDKKRNGPSLRLYPWAADRGVGRF